MLAPFHDYFGGLPWTSECKVESKHFYQRLLRCVHVCSDQSCAFDMRSRSVNTSVPAGPGKVRQYERGASTLVSDNGTCFRGADNTINELNLKFDQAQLRDHCQRFSTQWKFGPPGGPHHQGAVERMVQEVKKGMRHLGKADRLTFVEWETVFCQISGLINSRPLTAKSSSPLDNPPLTPNHFLIGRGDLPCPEVPCEEYVGNLRKRREICNAIVDGCWQRWMECIDKLSPRQKWQRSDENLQEGDIVIVISEDKKRGSWKMVEVLNIYLGKDDLVRVVRIRFAYGSHY